MIIIKNDIDIVVNSMIKFGYLFALHATTVQTEQAMNYLL